MEEESNDMDQILDYYKDWDSYSAPVMLMLDNSNEYAENLEAEDSKKMGYLRKKYSNK